MTKAQKQSTYSERIEAFNQASSEQARAWKAQNRNISLAAALIRMTWRFGNLYFFRGRVLRGYDGFREAFEAAIYELFCYAKYWELNQQERGLM